MQERMKNKIHYSPESRRDLDDIWDYIVSELQNHSAAERVLNRIMDAVDHLEDFAKSTSILVEEKKLPFIQCVTVVGCWTDTM